MKEVDFTDSRMKQVTFSVCDLRLAVFGGIDINALHFENPEPIKVQVQEQVHNTEPVQAPTQTQSADINIRYAEPVMEMNGQ